MMELLRAWLTGVTAAAILCALADSLMPPGPVRKAGKLAGGLVYGIMLVILFTVINLFGVKLGALLANVSMAAKLIPLAIIMFGALIFGKVTPEITFAPADGTTATFGSMLGMVSFAVVAALWAYDGWVNLNSVAEERLISMLEK